MVQSIHLSKKENNFIKKEFIQNEGIFLIKGENLIKELDTILRLGDSLKITMEI